MGRGQTEMISWRDSTFWIRLVFWWAASFAFIALMLRFIDAESMTPLEAKIAAGLIAIPALVISFSHARHYADSQDTRGFEVTLKSDVNEE